MAKKSQPQLQSKHSSICLARKFSTETTTPPHFLDPIGHFTSNEYDYPQRLQDITVKGGIHLAVMGGVDPVLGQLAISNPDLTIMTDINAGSVKTTAEGRISPITESQDGEEYWRKVGDYFQTTIRKIDPKRWDFPNDQDMEQGGWSNPEYFSQVKLAVENGKVKWIKGDMTSDGIEVAFKIAKETGVPIRLIYVSNIFDYSENNRVNFAQRLAQGIESGLIDSTAQVIDTSSPTEGLKTEVYDISSFIQKSSPPDA